MSAENLHRVPNHHLVHALNACFFNSCIAACMANHVRAHSGSHSRANSMTHIAHLEHKYLSIPGTSVRAERVLS